MVVVGGCGQRDREGAVVADEHAVLQVAEVATDHTAAGRRRLAVAQPVEPREVHDAGVLGLFAHLAGAHRGQPLGHHAAPAGGGHHQIGVQRGAIGEVQPGDVRPCAVVRGDHAVGSDAGAERHPTFGERRAAHDPLERGAPAGDHRQVVVARLADEALQRGRQVVAEAHLGGTRGEQRREHVGVAVAQRVAQTGEEGVAVAHLRCTTTVPLERCVGRVGHRRVVALEDRDLMTLSGERERGAEPGHATSHHCDVHGTEATRNTRSGCDRAFVTAPTPRGTPRSGGQHPDLDRAIGRHRPGEEGAHVGGSTRRRARCADR